MCGEASRYLPTRFALRHPRKFGVITCPFSRWLFLANILTKLQPLNNVSNPF
jgi:hypothetical protein